MITKSRKILIVATDKTVRLMAGFTLQLEDYEIIEAESMEAAMKRLDDGLLPDLILNGLDLIRSNGAEFVMAVRKRPEFRFVPILTLADEKVLRRQAEWKEAGITGWVAKPFTGRQLLEMVSMVMF